MTESETEKKTIIKNVIPKTSNGSASSDDDFDVPPNKIQKLSSPQKQEDEVSFSDSEVEVVKQISKTSPQKGKKPETPPKEKKTSGH